MGENVSLIDGHIDEKKQTNYERIRNMSVDELAKFISITSTNIAVKLDGEYVSNDQYFIKQWLESEVTE